MLHMHWESKLARAVLCARAELVAQDDMSSHACHSWEGTYLWVMHPQAAVPSSLASISSLPGRDVSTMLNPTRHLLSHAAGWSLNVSRLTASREERSAGWCMVERFLDRICVQLAHQPAAHAALVQRQQDLTWRTGKEILKELMQLAHVQMQRRSVHKLETGGGLPVGAIIHNLKVFLWGQGIAVKIASNMTMSRLLQRQRRESITCVLHVCNPGECHRPTTSLFLQATSGVYQNLLGCNRCGPRARFAQRLQCTCYHYRS